MRVIVVGAGVIGLTCAVRLAEGGYDVAVFARDLPLETTSSVAAAIWYPYLSAPEDRVAAWSRTTYEEFAKLAEAEPSVRMRHGREFLVEHPGGVAAGRVRGRVVVHDAGDRHAGVPACAGEAARAGWWDPDPGSVVGAADVG